VYFETFLSSFVLRDFYHVVATLGCGDQSVMMFRRVATVKATSRKNKESRQMQQKHKSVLTKAK